MFQFPVLAALAIALAAVPTVSADDKKSPVGVALVSATGIELAAEFEQNPAAAVKKFTPKKAPPGVMGGSVVVIHGTLARVPRPGQVQLASGNGWMILTRGPVEGEGPNVTVGVDAVWVNARGRLVVLEGTVTRSKDDRK